MVMLTDVLFVLQATSNNQLPKLKLEVVNKVCITDQGSAVCITDQGSAQTTPAAKQRPSSVQLDQVVIS